MRSHTASAPNAPEIKRSGFCVRAHARCLCVCAALRRALYARQPDRKHSRVCARRTREYSSSDAIVGSGGGDDAVTAPQWRRGVIFFQFMAFDGVCASALLCVCVCVVRGPQSCCINAVPRVIMFPAYVQQQRQRQQQCVFLEYDGHILKCSRTYTRTALCGSKTVVRCLCFACARTSSGQSADRKRARDHQNQFASAHIRVLFCCRDARVQVRARVCV